MSQPVQKKKPFFSCCAAEEDKNEAVIDYKDKRPVVLLPPPPPVQIKDNTFSVPLPLQSSSKFRFTYQNPTASFK